MRHTSIFAVLAGVLACVTAQAGDVYKYVDERGNTLYTDKPMPGAERVSTVAPRPPEAAARSYAEQQSATNSQLAASNQRVAQGQDDQRIASNVAKDLAASRAERCKKARDDYAKTIRSMSLYRMKDGKREYLTEAELAQSRVNANRAVETICGPQG
jgi:nucleoid-associated protein YgaU